MNRQFSNAVLLLLIAAGCGLSVFSVSADEPTTASADSADHIRDLQAKAASDGKADFGYWGTDATDYTQWRTHSNRLIPVYTFGTAGAGDGIDLLSYSQDHSPYRSEDKVRQLYGYVPEQTVNPSAVWMDQTNIADIQRAAAAAGRKYIFLVVFDGMDWDTTQATSIYNENKVTYTEGRGTGTHFQSYTANGTTQFSYMVTSPHNDGSKVDVDQQTVLNPGGTVRGGYAAAIGGHAPWVSPTDPGYLIGKPAEGNPRHAYTDSASSAASMTAGIKTYNNSINVSPTGEPVVTVAHELQDQGYKVGIVSSVPISHATPACAYAHNVTRQDYQDISRDMLGLPSISHPDTPLSGLDVVIGGGYGKSGDKGDAQGANYEPGNVYFADSDLKRSRLANGGKYVTAVRREGRNGAQVLKRAAKRAREGEHRLLGFYGVGQYNGHLPFQTADGQYDPVRGNSKKPEQYSKADIEENPNLAQMTSAAISVLETNPKGFWLMVEAGDVDWANHDNNLDNSIGAVNSGDAAVKVITDWVETNSNWQESIVIVTADHGHYFHLTQPEALTTSR
jgi:alkaline phosphatase